VKTVRKYDTNLHSQRFITDTDEIEEIPFVPKNIYRNLNEREKSESQLIIARTRS
jgi:hypothetical protein